MHEQSPLRTKNLILIMFLIGGVILTLFYYDIDILKCSSVIYPTEKIMEVRDNSTQPVSKTTTPKTLHNTTSRSFMKPTYATQSHHNVTPAINTIRPDVKKDTDLKFLVSNPNCKMLDLDPFNEEAQRYFSPEKYKSCRSLNLLTYVTKTDNIATLHIDTDLIPSYSKNGVSCCFSTVTRKHDINNPDAKISISPCQTFESNVTLHTNPVIVKCQNKRHKQVYENAHVAVTITDDVQKKINNSDNNTRKPSILFVGIDSISRLNFIRSLPNTYKYIEENGWLTLKGYNKIDDNTFPNLMAILTGFNSSTAFKVCNPKVLGKLNNCPMIWYDYRKLGYVTGYAEDDSPINTFNYNKIGFREPPTDYYFRSYIMATEKLTKVTKDELVYCTGPETAGERIMNLAKDFAVTFRDYPNFGFFWMNSFSHNKINSPTGMDNKIKSLIKDLKNNGVLKNSIVVFLSDHGMRFGNIRMTNTGWLEERLPFVYFSFPKWFQEKFQRELHNFKINKGRLTSPFDLHLTLQHILKLTGKNYTLTPADGCPKCRSLFEEIDTERSCDDAGITTHWCTCHGYIPASFSKDIQDKLTSFILKHIHNVIRIRNHDHFCAKYSVDRVLSMRISQRISNRNETSVLTQFQTKPKATFESTITFDGDIDNQQFYLSGDISRLDSYSDVSKCVKDAYLKKYCYCQSHG